MTDKRLKSFLEDRLKRLESIRNEREFTTAELGDIACCKQTLAFIDSLQEEPASEELEEAAKRYATEGDEISGLYIIDEEVEAFKAGAKWQKEQMGKEYSDLNKGLVSAKGVAVYMAYETGKKDIIGKVRSILNKVACENYGLDVNGDYCEQPYIELDDEFKKLLKED